MTEWISNVLGTVPAWAVYAAVFALPFFESLLLLGLIVPGETVLIFGGVLAGNGTVSLGWVLVLGITAALLGDSAGYAVGRRYGRQVKLSRLGRLVGEHRWQSSENLLLRHGGTAVLIGRYIGFVRTMVPGAAGMARMPYRTFVTWNVLGGASWATLSVVGGWAIGETIGKFVTGLTYVLLAALVLLAGRSLLRRTRARRSGDPPGEGRSRSEPPDEAVRVPEVV